MRIGERAGATDPGRKRRRNEDSYVVDPPLFAVADGMGGAQAGEVASRLAAAAFREYHEADELPAGERLAAIVQEANRRIYERAREDAQASGMGTTVTAALLDGERLVLGHVGDSRAYLLRGDEVTQLTDDHSLVADLVRSGRLTPAEAEAHPQRSVITRALGTDPEVDVDAIVVEAQPGDVILLCSDGLTTMVTDDAILRIVQGASSLEDAAKELVRAANRGGGEDNVTVILFRIEDGEDPALDETQAMATNGDPGDDIDLEDTLSGLEPAAPAAAAPPEPPPPEPEPEPTPRRRGRRLVLVLVLLLLVAALALAGYWFLVR
jgi:serine/threonine protein phosphatase PrpC